MSDLRPLHPVEAADWHAGHFHIDGAVETEHGVLVPNRVVTVHRTYFLESDVHDGDFPRDDTWTDTYECDSVDDAVRIIEREGLSFASTGTLWAANPDGSSIVDYATGKRVEETAHLSGFTPDEETAIVERVG